MVDSDNNSRKWQIMTKTVENVDNDKNSRKCR